MSSAAGPGTEPVWVLGEPEDGDALWLAAALRDRGVEVEFVLPEELVADAVLTLRIDAGVASSLRLQDGRALAAGSASLIINRLVGLAEPTAASTADRAFLAEEWRAAVVAWLRSLACPVINPPRAASVRGPELPVAAWRATASAFGIPVADWDSRTEASEEGSFELLCLGGRVLGQRPIPRALARSLGAVAEYVGLPLLGVRLREEGGRLLFLDATARPALAPGGRALVDGLLAAAGLSKDAR